MTSSRKVPSKVLKRVEVYSSEDPAGPDLSPSLESVRSLFPSVIVELRPSVSRGMSSKKLEAAALSIAQARVKDPDKAEQDFEPMYGEADYESRALHGEAKVGGVVYDGRLLAEAFREHFLGSLSNDTAHVVLTDRLVTTFSRDDLRHHLRTLVCGFPSIVSLSGIVEAPAKPREYYVMKQELEMRGAGELQLERLKASFSGRFIDYGDQRTPQIVSGLLLQAVMYHLTLDPFCEDSKCRLFNAHWQEDLIGSQVTSAALCRKHTKQISELAKSPAISW
jgi:hypothetical protein